ncbi:MAG: toprim domain-containing protein, partial [Rhodocyclaceae bacterium]|nr:toprim domain-containing protein [Rhodocyclaceae bacterium]
MRVVIAEKPSLGRAIAEALPGRFTPLQSGKNTYALKGDGIVVTWAYGHILEMAPPETYDPRYKRWRVEDLPIVPQNFVLQEKEPAQLKAIASLLRQAKDVVNAGDPDREGQLLIDEILEYLRWRGPTWRLLPHATDPESIRKAWAKLRPNEEFRPLYHAALCRQRADWLVGMNASRAATLLLTSQNQLVPLGRVMTPT